MVKNILCSTMSRKGQVTVPLEIRLRLGLKEGDRIEFVSCDDQTVIRPARPEGNPFETYLGILPAFQSKRQIDDWVAELREDHQDS